MKFEDLSEDEIQREIQKLKDHYKKWENYYSQISLSPPKTDEELRHLVKLSFEPNPFIQMVKP